MPLEQDRTTPKNRCKKDLPEKNVTKKYNNYFYKTIRQKKAPPFLTELLYIDCLLPFYSLLTIAAKASGWFIARSARTLRFSVILAALTLPINAE